MSKTKSEQKDDGNDVLRAVQWLARQYPQQWSQEAVCRWLASHPVVQQLLNDRLQAFVNTVALPAAMRRQEEIEAMSRGKKAKAEAV